MKESAYARTRTRAPCKPGQQVTEQCNGKQRTAGPRITHTGSRHLYGVRNPIAASKDRRHEYHGGRHKHGKHSSPAPRAAHHGSSFQLPGSRIPKLRNSHGHSQLPSSTAALQQPRQLGSMALLDHKSSSLNMRQNAEWETGSAGSTKVVNHCHNHMSQKNVLGQYHH